MAGAPPQQGGCCDTSRKSMDVIEEESEKLGLHLALAMIRGLLREPLSLWVLIYKMDKKGL